LHRLLSQSGFTDADAIRQQVEAYKVNSDSVKLFMQEQRYVKDYSDFTLIKEVYEDYKRFCMDDGYQPTGKTKFMQRLKNDGIHVEKKNIGNVAYLRKDAAA